MAFEKAKVLKAAEKFLSQGKINAAIKEYRQIVQHDDSDLTTLNMLGDLCARTGNKEEAISCFSRIAEHYREQQFTLKAIAMYKKIERLKPRDLEVAAKLADLYATQGLIVDARAQYLIVADGYTRAGNAERMLETLHNIADLDPPNTEIRLKLAEGYLKEGLRTEAATAFLEAGSRLLETEAYEKALEAYSKVLALRHNDRTAIKGLVAAHVALGTTDEAAQVLAQVVEEIPDDTELISLLAQTYIDAEDPKGAEDATSLLMTHDASNYTRFIGVARLYLNLGEVNDSVRVLAGIIEKMLAGREETDLLELVNEVLARNPEHVGALRLLSRIHWWQRDMEKLRSSLERLVEAAQAAGLEEDERYALTQLVRLSPEDRQYDQRLSVLGGFQEDLVEEPQGAVESEISEPPPTFESFAIVSEETAEVEVPTGAEGGEFEWNSVAATTPSDPSASFADLSEVTDTVESGFTSNSGFELSGAQEIDFSSAVVNAQESGLSSGMDDARTESTIRQELESVDFYIEQGYNDIAFDTLNLLERQFGSSADIQSRRQRLEGGATVQVDPSQDFVFDTEVPLSSPPTTEPIHGIESFEISSSPATEVNEAAANTGIDSGLAEIFEEFRVAAEEDQPATAEDFETHYNMGTAYKEMDLMDEAIQEFQAAAGATKPDDGTSRFLQCCNMLGHCFLQKGMPRAAVIWFKKGLDAPAQSEAETLALRYELASAYEQMGDFGRALDAFTEVYGINVAYREVAEKLKSLQGYKKKRKKSGKREVAE